MVIGCLEDVYRAFFLRECCVSGSAVCQGLLFIVRDYYLLSGTIILQGLLFVRDYCFFARDCYCRAMHCSINKSIIVSAVCFTWLDVDTCSIPLLSRIRTTPRRGARTPTPWEGTCCVDGVCVLMVSVVVLSH